MTTASDIITRSLRRIGVVSRDESADASDMSAGLDSLNDMIHGWKAKGVDLTHTDYTASSDVTIPREFQEGVIYLLAAKLAPEYSRPTPTADGFDIDEWWRAFLNEYVTVAAQTIDSGLLCMPSQRKYYTSA